MIAIPISLALAVQAIAPSATGALEQSRSFSASAAEVMRIAQVAHRNGDVNTAEKAYLALLQDRSPQIRGEAGFRLAKLAAERGRLKEAATLMRRILDDHPDASLVRLELAQILDRIGDKDGAWREMRSLQAGRLSPEVARLIGRYADALGASRPFGANFEIAVAPDSNINRATREDSLGTVIGDFEIDEDSKAKSGVGLALRGQAYRRVALGDGGLSLLGRMSASGDLYRASEFNDIAADFAVGPELTIGRDKLSMEAGLTRRWLGQKPVASSLRLAASWTKALGARSQLRLGASAASTDYRLNDLQDGRSYSGHASFEHALSPTLGVGLTVGADRQALKDPGYSTRAWRLGLLAWKDLGRMTVTGEVQYGRLVADERLSLFPNKRSETSSRIRLGAAFRQFGFGGFAPTARLVFERNRSSIEFYDYRRIRTEFGLVRAF